MKPTPANRRWITVLRWVARVMSLVFFGFGVMIAVTPDPNAAGPLSLMEWIEVGLLGLAVVGLVLAWRWEAAGASLALVSIAAQDVVFRLNRGIWFHSMLNTFLLMLVLSVPAVLYLLCWYLSRDKAMERPSEVRPAS